jgi:hypothetical protein
MEILRSDIGTECVVRRWGYSIDPRYTYIERAKDARQNTKFTAKSDDLRMRRSLRRRPVLQVRTYHTGVG